MADPVPHFEISVDRVERTVHNDKQVPETVTVTFAIKRPKGYPDFEIPVTVSVIHYDEAEMIKIARSYLHVTLDVLRSQTENWKLSPEWHAKHRKDQK